MTCCEVLPGGFTAVRGCGKIGETVYSLARLNHATEPLHFGIGLPPQTECNFLIITNKFIQTPAGPDAGDGARPREIRGGGARGVREPRRADGNVADPDQPDQARPGGRGMP